MKSRTFGNEQVGGIPNPNIASPLFGVVFQFAYGNTSEQGFKLVLGSSKRNIADLCSCHSILGMLKQMIILVILPAWVLLYMKESSGTCRHITSFHI